MKDLPGFIYIAVKHDCVFGDDFSLDEISYVSKVNILHVHLSLVSNTM